MADQDARLSFAVCVANEGCDDLSPGMIYRLLPDEEAAREGYLRVVDDSGEDYLYPAGRFVVVEASPGDEQKLLAVTSANVA